MLGRANFNMKTVLNLSNPNNKENTLFLGKPLGISNFADMRYPIFKKLYDEQLSFFWRPTEIGMGRDQNDILKMNKIERYIFEKNLAFQTAGDAFLGKGIEGILEYVTNNELYQTLTVHSFFESSIHTPSYSHIFENIYSNPADKFYEILNDKDILARIKESTQKFNTLLNFNGNDIRGDIINTIVGLLALESVAFYNSFVTSFYFAKHGKMTGTGDIITLIARDENLHISNSINILKILTTVESEGFYDIKKEIQEKIVESFRLIAEQEVKWVDCLLSEGELPGLTKESLKIYVKYLVNAKLVQLGLKPLFEKVTNPFPWQKSYLSSSKSSQAAPQEKQIVNYVKSSKNDMGEIDYSKM